MKTFKTFITEEGLDLRTSGDVPHDLDDADVKRHVRVRTLHVQTTKVSVLPKH